MHGLSDLRVIDFTTDVAGGYCTKLLADGGADVIKVEPPEGDPMRRWAPPGVELAENEDGALFRYLHTSKRSVLSTAEDLAELVEGADIIIDHADTDWADRFGHLVVVSITPFGRGGPFDDQPAHELTIQAESGGIAGRGRPDMDPIHAGGRIVAYTTGAYAAPAAAAAAIRAQRTGVGERVDVSAVEVANIALTVFADVNNSLAGRPDISDTVARSVETPSIEPALDGWVGFNTNTGDQWQAFCLLIERPDLVDAEWAAVRNRAAQLDDFNAVVHAWTTQHPLAEILELAAELRVPCAPVLDGASLPDHEHLAERGVFVPNPSGDFVQPRPPYLVDGEHIRPFGPVPAVGEHGGQVEHRVRPSPSGADDGALPLAGLRVLDLTSWWAGPSSTSMLADLGADVVHVESTSHPDGMRLTGMMFGAEDWWEWGHLFVAVNRNKRAVTLDLNDDAGLDALRRLVGWADIVAENFSPRVMDKFGFDAAGVRALNPNCVHVRMPAFGLSGPWRERVGFAQTMEQMAGMAWVTGFESDQPRIMRGPPDPIAGMHAAMAMLVGLAEREETGRGVFIESTMIEAALNCAPEQVIDFGAYGYEHARMGNRGPYAAPQGLYRCRGGLDEWVAIAVDSDERWCALIEVLGSPAWAAEPSLATDAGRRAAHHLIDEHLVTWAGLRTVDEAVALLIGAGVPAGRMVDPRRQFEHPQMQARGFFEEVDHPSVGRHTVPGLPFRFASVDRWTRSPSPTLGQHNEEVLTELGYSHTEISDFERDGVIGTRPFGL